MGQKGRGVQRAQKEALDNKEGKDFDSIGQNTQRCGSVRYKQKQVETLKYVEQGIP